jgi:Tol biopolymer transport system component
MAAVGRPRFAFDRGGRFQSYVMNVDGTSPIRVTNDATIDFDPTWKSVS